MNRLLVKEKNKYVDYAWRKKKRQLNKENLRATIKHDSGSVMVSGCRSIAGVGNLQCIEGTINVP